MLAQTPVGKRPQMMAELQAEMSSVMAAAVHHGLIPVEEMLDLLDSAALPTTYIEPDGLASSSADKTEREWALWTAQAYLDPSVAGMPVSPQLAPVPGHHICLRHQAHGYCLCHLQRMCRAAALARVAGLFSECCSTSSQH